MIRTTQRALAALVLGTVAPAQAATTDLGYLMANFGQIAFGDVTNASETTTNFIVGNDLTGGVSFNARGSAPATLGGVTANAIVGGDLRNGSRYVVNNDGSLVIGGINDGDIQINGSQGYLGIGGVNFGNILANQNEVVIGGDDFGHVAGSNVSTNRGNDLAAMVRASLDGLQAEFIGLSGYLASLDDTEGAALVSSDGVNYALRSGDGSGPLDGIAILNLTADEFDAVFAYGNKAVNSVLLDADTLIVNVAGSSFDQRAPSNLNNANVLFNFHEAKDLRLDTLNASILAPEADITLAGGRFDYTLVGYNFEQYAAIGGTFGGSIPEVPLNGWESEPAIVPLPASGLVMLGAIGMLVVVGRRRAG